ncbi:unnamed protein product [Peronospora belbahrii]|uniref:BZIP domain-containing protein n=1 Tax=Peronospora belbahrii TaxID=622444 RepID=A0ABN8DAY2_9STRA|nr:unnamed protein product [Peronospora belbahrii]
MPTTAFFPPLTIRNQSLCDDLETMCLPVNASAPVMLDGTSAFDGAFDGELMLSLFRPSDGSNESDSEHLMSLIESFKSNYAMHDESDREDRPYPYTRSKTRWRKRPNDELKHLRSQIVKLEGLVTNLTYSGSRSKVPTNRKKARDDQSNVLHRLSKESRRKKMEAAMAENRKLKLMVVSQFRVAKALQTAVDESMRLRARKVCWPTSSAASDELVFALLDEEKELQYAATDKVMDESGVSRMYHPYISEMVFQNDKNGVSFQHNDVRVIPFPVANVVSALRHSLRHRSRVGPSEHCRKFLMYDNYSQAVTLDSVDIPGSLPATVTGRHLLWSVTEPDRTVIAWSSFNEYQGRSHVRLLKRLWFSVEPTQVQTSSGTVQGSILRTIVRFTPVDPEVDLKHIKEMSDVIICAYKRDSVRVVLAVRDQLAALAARG